MRQNILLHNTYLEIKARSTKRDFSTSTQQTQWRIFIRALHLHFRTPADYRFYSYQQIHKHSSNGGMDCANFKLLAKRFSEGSSNSWIDGDGTCATMHLTWSTIDIIQIVERKYRWKIKTLNSESSFHLLKPLGCN